MTIHPITPWEPCPCMQAIKFQNNKCLLMSSVPSVTQETQRTITVIDPSKFYYSFVVGFYVLATQHTPSGSMTQHLRKQLSSNWPKPNRKYPLLEPAYSVVGSRASNVYIEAVVSLTFLYFSPYSPLFIPPLNDTKVASSVGLVFIVPLELFWRQWTLFAVCFSSRAYINLII